MARYKMLQALLILFSTFSIALTGCGGGGGGASDVSGGGNDPSSSPQSSLKVLPANYDFGIVTDGNYPETLEVTIQNTGTANLSVSDITISDPSNFDLNVNAGVNPCASTAPTIPAGSSCSATVDFTPTSFDVFGADLTIHSSDPVSPVYKMGLIGTKQDISALHVKINQIDACPRSTNPATVYVSVIDQGGFPVMGLASSNFAINEVGDDGVPGAGDVPTNEITVAQVNDQYHISVALAMDYSGSITSEPENVVDMEHALTEFANELGANDEAEIIKFATGIETTQSFTSDKALITTAIQSTPDIGTDTKLYDAVVRAVDNASNGANERKAVIAITDGKDNGSVNTLSDVIADANAKGIPVFTVGLGNADTTSLQQMADGTGGTYSDAATSDNLIQIYKQLANLLFTNQYILTYPSGLADTVTGNLTVTATYGTASPGSDIRTISLCQ
jgi:VWFA-related protein